ncbi:MAG TPA: T9SS type A sorting domain-containing protein [Bacteroidales bacterium]|nr:T9SS type A sorting domain-containing protein [Bacteroidales bacterium]
MKKIIVITSLLTSILCGTILAQPGIQFDSVPPYQSGNPGFLFGHVSGVNPNNYKVAVIIFIEGIGWWYKSYSSLPYVQINADSTFSCYAANGGLDDCATIYRAFLVHDTNTGLIPYHQGSACIDSVLYYISTAFASISRPPKTIPFCGYTWWVKSSNNFPVGPDNNYFSDDASNVWLDQDGRVHLKIHYSNNHWYCSEIYLSDTSYPDSARFVFYIEQINSLDSNSVLGLFTWQNDICPYHSEFDIEFSQNLVGTHNTQYVIQPWTNPNNILKWQMPSCDSSTHIIHWNQDSVEFASYNGFHDYPFPGLTPLNSWKYNGPALPVSPPKTRDIRINLWLVNGLPPANGQDVEIIVSKCESFDLSVNSSENARNIKYVCYPNPFDNMITFEYSLTESSQISLEIYNIFGQKVETIIDCFQTAGNYKIIHDTHELMDGYYISILQLGRNKLAEKIVKINH